ELRGDARSLAVGDRIAAVEPRPATFQRPLARLSKADGMQRPQAHFPQSPAFLEAEDPALRAAGADLQEQPATVAVVAAPLGLRDGQRRQFTDRPRHRPPFCLPIQLPNHLKRIVANDGGRHKSRRTYITPILGWVRITA